MTVHDRIPDGSGSDSLPDAVRVDWTKYGEPSSGVVEGVSRATGERPTDLPPLHDAVETDALNVLVTDGERTTDSPFTITFSYAHHQITVTAAGKVIVESG